VDAGLVNEAADHMDRGVKLAGEAGHAGVVLAARHEVAAKVGEPQRMSVLVEAALLLIDDGNVADNGEPAGRWRW